jgi:hypothetical protein
MFGILILNLALLLGILNISSHLDFFMIFWYLFRSAVIGTAYIAAICSSNQYSIVEYAGLNSIQNAAHELAHK